MDYYFVGDEGSLGSYADPVDFCFGPHTLARFRSWLREPVRLARGAEPLVDERLRRLGRGRAARPPTRRARAAASRRGPTTARTWRRPSRTPTRRCAQAVVEGDPDGPHRALRDAGHDAVERLRLAPARPGRRRLPLLQRRQPVGDPPLVREARRARRLLDRLRAQRRGGEARGLVGGARRCPLPEPLLEPLDRQPRPDVLALRTRPRRGVPGAALRGHRQAADGGGARVRRRRRSTTRWPSVHAAGILGQHARRRRRGRARCPRSATSRARATAGCACCRTSASRRTSSPPTRWRRAASTAGASSCCPTRWRSRTREVARPARLRGAGRRAARRRRRRASSTSTRTGARAGRSTTCSGSRRPPADERAQGRGSRGRPGRRSRPRARPRGLKGGAWPGLARTRAAAEGDRPARPLLRVGGVDAVDRARVGEGWTVVSQPAARPLRRRPRPAGRRGVPCRSSSASSITRECDRPSR